MVCMLHECTLRKLAVFMLIVLYLLKVSKPQGERMVVSEAACQSDALRSCLEESLRCFLISLNRLKWSKLSNTFVSITQKVYYQYVLETLERLSLLR